MPNITPILVTGTFTPGGTQDVRITAQTITLAISAISLPLPTGAATEATLAEIEAELDQFTFASTRLLVDGSGVIQPVSGTISAVQSGSWTVSLTTESIEIGKVDQGTPNTAANKWPIEIVDSAGVNIASVTATNALKVDGSAVTQPISGTIAVTQSTSPWVISGTVTANAGTNLNTSLLLLDSTFTTRINTLGQKTMANSTPIVIASDQSAIPVSGTIVIVPSGIQTVAIDQSGDNNDVDVIASVLPTNAAQETGGNLASIKTDLDKFTFTTTRLLVDGSGVTQPISGTVTANIGTTNGLALDATLTGGNQKTKIVDGGGTNVASVDATGDIQVDVNNFPATQAISAVSLPLPTGAATEATLVTRLQGTVSSSAVTSVAASASNVTLLASNSSRRIATIYNDSAFRVFVKFGATASTSSFTVRIDSQGYYELPLPCYTGQIDGIWNGATGNARITELS